MNTAAVIIIGNEILSGRTQDTNVAFLGRRLSDLGIGLLEVRIIPDDEETIIRTVNQYRSQFTYVFTTGGIGPTHDDITSASVARAFDVSLEENPEAVASMEKYYGRKNMNEARMKMACVPVTATLIPNPVSGAPGFQIENVFVLPGVPEILQAMFDGITHRLTGGPPILSHSVCTNLRESTLAEGLGLIQNMYPDVAIGSYPYFKRGKLGVNLVMRSTNAISLDKTREEVRELVLQLNGKILLLD